MFEFSRTEYALYFGTIMFCSDVRIFDLSTDSLFVFVFLFQTVFFAFYGISVTSRFLVFFLRLITVVFVPEFNRICFYI